MNFSRMKMLKLTRRTMDHYLRLHCKNAKIVNDRIDLKFVLTGSKIVKLLLITFSIE